MFSSCRGANAHGAGSVEGGGGGLEGVCGSAGGSGSGAGGRLDGLDKQVGSSEADGHGGDEVGVDDGGSPAWAALLPLGQCGDLACPRHRCTYVWCTY